MLDTFDLNMSGNGNGCIQLVLYDRIVIGARFLEWK
jgi:hypothetical protein